MHLNHLLTGVFLIQTAVAVIVPTPGAPLEPNQRRVGGTIRALKRNAEGHLKRFLGLAVRDELIYYGDYSSYGTVSSTSVLLHSTRASDSMNIVASLLSDI